jgi:hypothetical protein
MFRLTTLLRSLGHQGALANVQAVLEARTREDWLVEGLCHRLEGPVAARVRQAA